MRHFIFRWRRRHRAFTATLGAATLALVFVFVPGGEAVSALATTLTTPYPVMTVQAGQTVNVELSVTDSVAQRVDLSVEGVPSGWKATILGGGRPIGAVMTNPDSSNQPSAVQLQIQIPADAVENTSTLTVVARSATGSVSMPISLTVSAVEGGTTTLEAEYSSLRGPADATYAFSLTLANSTLEGRTYNLTATGPDNWTLSLKPSGASQETPTVSVESQGSQGLDLNVTPGPNVEIGTYELTVTATGGGETVSVPLQIEITGTYALTLATPDGNLNADVKAGGTTRVQIAVTNNGTGALQGVELSAAAPANWDVTFEPSTINVLPAGQQQTVVATFTPARDAIAGDYVVSMNARADQATAQADIRTTVKTSTLWGVIGVLIAVAAIAILGFVFRRYGHR